MANVVSFSDPSVTGIRKCGTSIDVMVNGNWYRTSYTSAALQSADLFYPEIPLSEPVEGTTDDFPTSGVEEQ